VDYHRRPAERVGSSTIGAIVLVVPISSIAERAASTRQQQQIHKHQATWYIDEDDDDVPPRTRLKLFFAGGCVMVFLNDSIEL
jgi:hypothetical protein